MFIVWFSTFIFNVFFATFHAFFFHSGCCFVIILRVGEVLEFLDHFFLVAYRSIGHFKIGVFVCVEVDWQLQRLLFLLIITLSLFIILVIILNFCTIIFVKSGHIHFNWIKLIDLIEILLVWIRTWLLLQLVLLDAKFSFFLNVLNKLHS